MTSQDTFSPAGAEELREAILSTRSTHPKLLVAGAGTAASWGAPALPADAVVSTTALSGLLDYAPADLTVAVRAGTPLTVIQETVAEAGQRVAFDPARAQRGATVGGLLATADAGPLRTAFGSLRDLVIGVTLVLSDGTVARSGGRVIKNVAGYDLAKLFHGSLGTLGVVAEVVLRLHPLPQRTSTVAVAADPAEGFALAGKIIMAGLEPSALEWAGVSEPADGQLLVKLEGTDAGVDQRAREVSRIAGSSATVLSVDEADRVWRRVAATADGDPSSTVVRVGTLPSAGPATVMKVVAAARESGVLAMVTSSMAIGVHTLHFVGGVHDELLTRLQLEYGAAVTVQRRDGLSAASGWGPPPASLQMMRAIKKQFDRDSRFGAGRFAPWLDDEERAG